MLVGGQGEVGQGREGGGEGLAGSGGLHAVQRGGGGAGWVWRERGGCSGQRGRGLGGLPLPPSTVPTPPSICPPYAQLPPCVTLRANCLCTFMPPPVNACSCTTMPPPPCPCLQLHHDPQEQETSVSMLAHGTVVLLVLGRSVSMLAHGTVVLLLS